MRGIACQQHSAFAPLLGDTGAKGVDGLALDPHRAVDLPRASIRSTAASVQTCSRASPGRIMNSQR